MLIRFKVTLHGVQNPSITSVPKVMIISIQHHEQGFHWITSYLLQISSNLKQQNVI